MIQQYSTRRPINVFPRLQQLKKRLSEKKEITAFHWALHSPRRASFYYWFFSKRFDREHYSVLYGKYLNLSNDINSLANDALLRRSLHMIEKGLTAIPRRPVWAENYILDTLSALHYVLQKKCNDTTHRWAFDVLTRFFENTMSKEITNQAKSIFTDLVKKYPLALDGSTPHCPYRREDTEPSGVDYTAFMKLCRQRHSIRWYQNKEVPLDLVRQAIEAALAAPSACNRQPFRFIIIRDKKKLARVVRMPIGCDTFAYNIKMMVALIGDLSAYFDERDRHLIYLDGGLAAMNFMLALETQGLSSCPVNWPDIEAREQIIFREFDLSTNERGILFFSVGYPLMEADVPFSARKSVEQVIQIR